MTLGRPRLSRLALFAFAVLGYTAVSPCQAAVAPTDGEMQAARSWAAAHLVAESDETAVTPPFSFTYGSQQSAQLLAQWPRQREQIQLDDRRTQQTLTWTDPETGLEVRCVTIAYRDFPVVEWTVYFRNTGSAPTAILENIQALDVTWQREEAQEFLLHHGVGSPADGSDYGPLESPLGPTFVKRISAAGGRPTNSDLSYFNLQWGAQGVILAVGWPGQWAAQFARDDQRGVHVQAGQELTHFALVPGEEVRSPLMALLFWQGDRLRSQNLWRRWMMAHSMPRPGGKLPPPQFVASSSRAYEEMIGANEANQIMHIDRYLEERLPLNYWWMDAGWYIQQQGWPQVGTWEIDPQRFPHGFQPISEHAHQRGVKILVWFEPERVAPGTWLYEQHPEWLLTGRPKDDPQAGMRGWAARESGGSDPCVAFNPTDQVRTFANIRWEPGQLSFHPGGKGEYSVVRWTAQQPGTYDVQAEFQAIDQSTTTDVHVLRGDKSLLSDKLQLDGRGKQAAYQGKVEVAAGDTIDCVVGWGNGTHVCDSTGLVFRVTDAQGNTADAAKEFSADTAVTGPWSYGYLPPASAPDVAAFRVFDRKTEPGEAGTRLLNLGDPAAREWLTNHVDRLITEQGIDLYRQDFNIDPLAFWRANDAPDRQGITEIKHVTGYLAYWDELRRRHPDMLIDTCASGGRRNDLETLRRAVPLWRSDYAYEPVGHQCMSYGISLWMPYHGTGTVACAEAKYYGGGTTPVEPYAFWSNAAPSLGSGIDVRVRELDYDTFRRLVEQWRSISRFYYGDFYPLTAYSRDKNAWIAWQFHDANLNQGAVQAFRRSECTESAIALKLHGLDPAAQYEVTQFDVAGSTSATGRELMETGLQVSIPQQPGAAIFTYRRVLVHAGLAESLDTITEPELLEYARHLASDQMEGRRMGMTGGIAAGDFLAEEMKKLGLAPGGPDGQYLQDCGRGCRNVLGLLIGSDPALADQTVIVGAHYDHVGVAAPRADGPTRDVYNGANDNASGVAGVLEVAEAMTKLPQPPRRTVLFALWDGEERGFVGSAYFAGNPTVNLDQVTATVNVDMIGRAVDNQLIVWGTGTAAAWPEILTAANAGPALNLDLRPFTLPLSDHVPFFSRKIPAVLVCTGMFPELHKTTDDVELLNADGMRRITQLLQAAVCELANRPERLEFVEASLVDVTHDLMRKADDPRPERRRRTRSDRMNIGR